MLLQINSIYISSEEFTYFWGNNSIFFFLQVSTPIFNVCKFFFNCYRYSRSLIDHYLWRFTDWRKHCLQYLFMTEWKNYCVYRCQLKGSLESKKIVIVVDDNHVINLTELRKMTSIRIGNKDKKKVQSIFWPFVLKILILFIASIISQIIFLPLENYNFLIYYRCTVFF